MASLLRNSRAAPAETIPPIPAAVQWPVVRHGDVLLFVGIPHPEQLSQALAEPATVVIIGTSPDLAVALLRRFDVANGVSQGRLMLCVRLAASSVMRELANREFCALVNRLLRTSGGSVHMVPGQLNQDPSLAATLRSAAQNAVTLVKGMATIERTDSVDFDVTVVSPHCAQFQDLAESFQCLGLRTQVFLVPDVAASLSVEQRREGLLKLAHNKSRLIVTRNRVLFETVHVADVTSPELLFSCPVVSWWWDVPNVATFSDLRYLPQQTRPYVFARQIEAVFHGDAAWLPPAARMPFTRFAQDPLPPLRYGVSFVGQSRYEGILENLRSLSRLLDLLAPQSGATTRLLLRPEACLDKYATLSSIAADMRAQAAIVSKSHAVAGYFIGYLFEMALTGSFRLAAIARLRQEGIPLTVFGDEGWLKSGAITVQELAGVCPLQRLPEIYRSSRVNLNLNFMQVSSTVNPKVMDCAACGATVLSDYRPEVETLFPDPARRPHVFSTLDELVVAVNRLLSSDNSARTQDLMKYTLEKHTMLHRARDIALQYQLLG